MGEELQAFLDKLLLRIDGLKAVIITDREGVAFLRATSPEGESSPPGLLESQPALLSTTFSIISDQASKLGLQKNKSIVSIVGNNQIVCFNHMPLVTTLVADLEANTGILLDLGDELKEITDIIATVINERQNIITS